MKVKLAMLTTTFVNMTWLATSLNQLQRLIKDSNFYFFFKIFFFNLKIINLIINYPGGNSLDPIYKKSLFR